MKDQRKKDQKHDKPEHPETPKKPDSGPESLEDDPPPDPNDGDINSPGKTGGG